MGLSYAVEILRLTQKNKQDRVGQTYTSYDRPASVRGSVSVDETGFPKWCCTRYPMGQIGRTRRDLNIPPTPQNRWKHAQKGFPRGNPFVEPATGCTLYYKRTLTIGGGNSSTRWRTAATAVSRGEPPPLLRGQDPLLPRSRAH